MKGDDDFIKRIKALGDVGQYIVAEIEATATDVEIDAIRAAPVSIGQKISKKASQGGLQQQIEVNAGAIGAYIEFGTGSSAAQLVPTLPDEWQAIARQFFVNGQGRLKSAPYLYPAWVRYTTGFEQRLKKIMEKAAK